MIILLRVRRYPIGIELVDAGADARVWAPGRTRVAVVHGASAEHTTALTAEPDGYFSGVVRGLRAGDRYGFRLDDDDEALSRPRVALPARRAARPSEVVDPARVRLERRRVARASAAAAR